MPRIRHAPGLLIALAAAPALAVAMPAPQNDLANMSLEELANIQVTSVSRRAERLADAAASVFVITGEDIRRSGARTLPEALRLAPNLDVAQIDAHDYAITARGFNNNLVNKMLVLIDGRAVYSPLYSGVFWDSQDVVLGDIERIEVISGPGATVWGTNAVNGVINIMTRRAEASQGGYASVAADKDLRKATARYGWRLAGGAARFYAKSMAADDTESASGAQVRSAWHRHQAGFRFDNDDLTVQGDTYSGAAEQSNGPDLSLDGGNLLARYAHTLEGGSAVRLQVYADRIMREQPARYAEHLSTYDIDLQHTVQLTPAQLLVWGGGHRVAQDRITNSAAFAFLPAAVNLAWTNLYAQDEITVTDALRMTAGLRIERNSYTGVEHMPYGSLAWQVRPDHLLWTSLARAVRTPSRIDRDFYIYGTPPYLLYGDPNFRSETAQVTQLGYRGRLLPQLSYAITVYYADYDSLRTVEPKGNPLPFVLQNNGTAQSRGMELSGTWEIQPHWRISFGHTAQRLHSYTVAGSRDTTAPTNFGTNDPASWSSLRSFYSWNDSVEFDVALRRVGDLPHPFLAGYTVLDLRLGWRSGPHLEWSLGVQNALDDLHAEFAPTSRGVATSEFGRTLTGRVTWRF